MFRTIVVAALLGVLASPAAAQSTQLWNCEEGVRDLTGNLPTVLWRYQLALHANGTYSEQGFILAIGNQYPMQGQGRWQVQGNMFRMVGQRQDSQMGVQPLELNLLIAGPAHMHDTTQSGNRVFAAQCQRSQ